MVLEKLSILMQLVISFGFFNLNWQIVPRVEGKSGIITRFGMVNDRHIMRKVELPPSYAIAIEVEFEDLAFFEA